MWVQNRMTYPWRLIELSQEYDHRLQTLAQILQLKKKR